MMMLTWNAREPAGKEFCHALKELIRNFNLKVVLLVETRCNGENAQWVIKRLGFSHQVIVET